MLRMQAGRASEFWVNLPETSSLMSPVLPPITGASPQPGQSILPDCRPLHRQIEAEAHLEFFKAWSF